MQKILQKFSFIFMIFMIIAMSATQLFLVQPAFAFAANQSLAIIHAPAANDPSGSGTSLNWSGYEATSGTFTGIGATWTIPTVAASSSLTADATWVGIGGVTSHDLIQVGTQAITGNGANQVQYEAWLETLPQATQQIPVTVNAGDSVTASLSQISTGQWQISFHDNTTGSQYAVQVAYASSLSSAEWIAEAPSDQDGLMQLDQFGAIPFSGAYVIQNGTQMTIAGAGGAMLSMVNSANQAMSIPSALNSDGASFTVSRTAAQATTGMGLGNFFFGSRGRHVGVGIQGFSPWRGGYGNASSSSSSSSTVAPTSSSSPNSFVNLGRGRFRIRVGMGGLNQGQLLQLLREQFNFKSRF
jgi:hypothetical protein